MTTLGGGPAGLEFHPQPHSSIVAFISQIGSVKTIAEPGSGSAEVAVAYIQRKPPIKSNAHPRSSLVSKHHVVVLRIKEDTFWTAGCNVGAERVTKVQSRKPDASPHIWRNRTGIVQIEKGVAHHGEDTDIPIRVAESETIRSVGNPVYFRVFE